MEDKVRDLLQKAGWFNGREVDISQYLDFLKDEEYYVFKGATDFLKEYGGLIIQFENPKRLDSYLTLNINPIDAASSIFREVSKRYERYCNESFVIVGEIPLMEMTWYISSSGTFYGGNDDFLIRLGDDFCQALHNIVSGVKLDVITVEDE
ncbi:SUKH-3 domain-containing protein [Brevibacillus agri]|uniref:SUKH-3 domain-containing protein n=1 Tax=Brevibacillus agri TaxID=51101 RepID=UPI00046EC20F|nr:SUKH-3 domain-containing protein [Brevibacillus agri]WHX31874.1 SUKH-3 domain-containing protein [Brevibacillus agri]